MIIYKRAKNKWKFHRKVNNSRNTLYLGNNVQVDIEGLVATAKSPFYLKIGDNSKIGLGEFYNNNVIGSNVTIKDGFYIMDSTIQNNVYIGTSVVVKNSIIQHNCVIHDNVRIFINTRIGYGSIIMPGSTIACYQIVKPGTETEVEFVDKDIVVTKYFDEYNGKKVYVTMISRRLFVFGENYKEDIEYHR